MYLREASERKEEKILHIEEHVKNLQLEKKKDNKMYTVTTTIGELRKLQVFVAAMYTSEASTFLCDVKGLKFVLLQLQTFVVVMA